MNRPTDSSNQNQDPLIAGAAQQIQALRRRVLPHERTARLGDPLFGREPVVLRPLRPESIEGYELLGERHRGGQGVVYEAFQKATKRKVAIKVLHEGPYSGPTSRRRFEREVEILSQLRHPNIVTVHDSGEAEGRFFYVMDLVAGRPLDRWVESRRDALREPGGLHDEKVRELLRLFVKVCDAVNAAHLRGVIHRDLKPGNVLIDGAGEPRVLDFGLAKFTAGLGDDPSNLPSMTQTGQFVGSLPWSAPEQAAGRTDDVDTRTDVYSLGVLLYQTLTGQFPYQVLGSAAETIDQIRHADPRPMQHALGQQPMRISGSELPRGRPRIDDEVETIVRRCLHKERERRYQTAGDLGRDLQRYLNHEPIEAKRDSIGYLLRKSLRRYRLPLAIVAAFVAMLVLSTIVSLALWRQAEAGRRLAEAESTRAQAAEADAQRKRAQAESVAEVLGSLFGSSSSDDGLAEFTGVDMTVRQMLDQHGEKVLARVEDDPESLLHVANVIGDAYRNLGAFERAFEVQRRALEQARATLGEGHPQVGACLHALSNSEVSLGRYDDAEAHLRASIQTFGMLGPKWRAAQVRSGLDLAQLLALQNRLPEVQSLVDDALRAAESSELDEHEHAQVLRAVATLHEARGEFEQAETRYRESLAIFESLYGPENMRTAMICNDLANSLTSQGKLEEARGLLERAVRVYEARLGPSNARVATCSNNLGVVLTNLKQHAEAEKWLAHGLELRQKLFPPDHPDVAASLNNLALCLERQRRYDEAIPLYRDCLSRLRPKLGDAHPNVLTGMANLARALNLAGSTQESLTVRREILGIRRKTLPSEHPDLAGALIQFGSQLLEAQSYAEAEAVLRECLQIRQKALPAGHWLTFNTMSVLGAAVLGQGRTEDAEKLLVDAYAGLKDAPDALPVRLKEAAQRLAKLYESTGEAEQAAHWAEIAQSHEPPAGP